MKIIEMLLNDANKTRFRDGTTDTVSSTPDENKALWSERSRLDIDVIVIHYISAIERHPSEPYKLEYIIDVFYEYGVSSHYLIDRKGVIYRLVPDFCKAWHAGRSIMPEPDNRQGINDFSIGIELLATNTSGFTGKQYRALAALCNEIEKSNNRKMTYIGHEHIAGEQAVAMGLRDDCKIDPGSLFDWDWFYKELERNRGKNVL